MSSSLLRKWFYMGSFLLYVTPAYLSNKCTSTYEGERLIPKNGQEMKRYVVKHVCEVDFFPMYLDDKAPHAPNYEDVVIKLLNTRVIPDKAFRNNSKHIKYGEIHIENQHLEEIASSAFESLNDLQEIHLSMNDLTNIRDRTFCIPSLEILDLSMNKIKYFSRTALIGSSNLRLLNLSSNYLQIFEVLPSIFSPHLNLDLSFNEFTSFQFENTSEKVEKLNLSHNSLTEIKGCFPAFSIMNVNNNKLRSITNVSCSFLTKESVYINLGSNSLSELNAGFFDKMYNLKYLYLDQNNLSSLPSEIFFGLHSLKVLNISHNHLTNLQHGLFDSLKNLLSLDMSHNDISDIKTSLHSLNQLQALNVEFNQLVQLDCEHLLIDSPHLRNLALDGNEFSCKYLIEIFRKLKNNQIVIPYGRTSVVDNIQGIRCYENDSSSENVEQGPDVLGEIEKAVLLLEKLAQYGNITIADNKSTGESMEEAFSTSKTIIIVFLAIFILVSVLILLLIFMMYVSSLKRRNNFQERVELFHS